MHWCVCVCEFAISPIPDSPHSSLVPLQPFASAVYGSVRWGEWGDGGAMPWIYTADLTIIHPRSFQIGSLLKVNCTG